MMGKNPGMKGFLTFLILWMLSRKAMTGAGIARELEKRKGAKPSPGTVYPALKEIRQKGLVRTNSRKEYALTQKGRKELESCLKSFFDIFCDIDDMKKCRC